MDRICTPLQLFSICVCWTHEAAVNFAESIGVRRPRRALLTSFAASVALLGSSLSAADSVKLRSVSASEDASADEVLLISTRAIGTACRPELMASSLRCERREWRDGRYLWRDVPWDDTLRKLQKSLPKIVYVHGNRVPSGVDRTHGMLVYERLPDPKPGDPPRQYIIWSWPSDQLRGPLKDYRIKADRTQEVGWQLAWVLEKLPTETPVALVGYSYGASIVTGALHLLSGGDVDGRRLPPPSSASESNLAPTRNRFDVALVAAAYDADWIASGGLWERAPQRIKRLMVVNNRLDPAMRFYHLTTPGRSARALGYAGPSGIAMERTRRFPVTAVDLTEKVGRTHALEEYLRAVPQLGPFLAENGQRDYNP